MINDNGQPRPETMTSSKPPHTPTPDVLVADQSPMTILQMQQDAWKAFAEGAVRMIPALKAQMTAVTQETERAAVDLLVHLQALASTDGTMTPKDRAASIAKVVMAMQFQDITRQKLEHVGSALDHIRNHLQALLKGPENEEARNTIATLQVVEQSYTMEEERRLHQAALQPDYQEPVPTDSSDKESDSVTLF